MGAVASSQRAHPGPDVAHGAWALDYVLDQLDDTAARIREIEARPVRWHRQSRVSQSLATVPGVGIIGASAIAATATRSILFRSGREFAAWLGMAPRQNSSGAKKCVGRTCKRGDKYIRSLFIAGAVVVLRHTRYRPTRDGDSRARRHHGLTGKALVGFLAVRLLKAREPGPTLPSAVGGWAAQRGNAPGTA